ncbi:hypothetical protein PHAVU_005G079650 [Phaseolus vulgaris]
MPLPAPSSSNSTMQFSITITQTRPTPLLLATTKHNGGRPRHPQTNQTTTTKHTDTPLLTKTAHNPQKGKDPGTY